MLERKLILDDQPSLPFTDERVDQRSVVGVSHKLRHKKLHAQKRVGYKVPDPTSTYEKHAP